MIRRILLAALVTVAPLCASAQNIGPVVGTAGQYGPPFTAQNGHLGVGGGPPPTINAACGTGAIAPVGTDSASFFTSGTSTSATCTLTFNTPTNRRPVCSVDAQAASQPNFSVSTTGIVISGVADSTTYNVLCINLPGN